MKPLVTSLFVLVLATTSSAAQAQGVGVTTRLLDFDVAHPDRESYRDTDVGTGVIGNAITLAWQDLSTSALNPVREWLGGADRLGPGMTARDIVITLGAPGQPSVAPTGQAQGRLTIPVSGNHIDLTSTHPASPGRSTDPRMRVVFDIVLTIDFLLTGRAPHLRAAAGILQPENARVSPLNTWADIGLGIDGLLSSLGGTKSIEARVRDAFSSQRIAVTNAFNSRLAANAGLFAMPKGYVYNGGRVEPDRIIIAAYRVMPFAGDRVTVLATWPKELGTLMRDCRPVGITASWQAGPRPFSGVPEPPRATATIQNMNPRIERRDQFACSVVMQVPKGAPLSLAWADPVRVTAASPNPIVMKTVVVARPSGWANPVLPTAPEYALALTRESQAGIGLQRDAASHAQQSPLDPVSRAGVEQRANPVIQQPRVRGAPTPVTAPAPAASSQLPVQGEPSMRNPPAATGVGVRIPGTQAIPGQATETVKRAPSEGP
jgi:hypothetical protein